LTCILKKIQEEDNAEAAGVDEDGDDDMLDLEALNYDDLDSVSKLQKTQRYIDIIQVCYQTRKYPLTLKYLSIA
jgi:hypothetical protein